MLSTLRKKSMDEEMMALVGCSRLLFVIVGSLAS